MKKRIILDFINNKIRFIVKLILLSAFFLVILCSLIINHIGDVFNEYITDNLNLYASVTSEINDDSFWTGNERDMRENFKKAREYFDYVESVDDALYSYKECTFVSNALMNVQFNNGVLVSELTYDNRNKTDSSFKNEISAFIEDQRTVSRWAFLGSNITSVIVDAPVFADIMNGDIEIIEGRAFTEEEIANGDNVCVVNSRTLYVGEENGEIVAHFLHPGDKVGVSISCSSEGGYVKESFELTVVGVYRPVNDFIHYRNSYYPLGFYRKIMDKMEEYDYMGINFNDTPGIAYFEVKGLAQLKELIKVIEENDHGYGYYTNTNEISDALSSCIAISKNIKSISLVSYITCLLFCVGLILLDVYYRKKEIGLLMSFGEKRTVIVKQIIIEEILLYVVASCLAFMLSKFISGAIVNYLLSSNASHDILVYGGHHAKAAVMNISLHFSPFDYLVYIAYIVLLVIVNMTVVNNQIKKYSPRELLSGE